MDTQRTVNTLTQGKLTVGDYLLEADTREIVHPLYKGEKLIMTVSSTTLAKMSNEQLHTR